MNEPDVSRRRAEDVVAAFVERINAHDVAGLGGLMTDDHVFVDALDSAGSCTHPGASGRS